MLLSLNDIHKAYADGVPVLRGVDLELADGDTVALTGESGSGKSTLLHLAAGLDTPDRGRISVAGVELETSGDAARAALRRSVIALIFQQFNLIPSLTVGANITFQARMAGREDPKITKALVGALGLDGHMRKYPEALSGGQQQRVAIARALAARPRLLLADEPTGNLDEATAVAVLREMLDLTRAAGTALLVVTHSERVAALMERRVHLSQGRLT